MDGWDLGLGRTRSARDNKKTGIVPSSLRLYRGILSQLCPAAVLPPEGTLNSCHKTPMEPHCNVNIKALDYAMKDNACHW